MPSVFDTLQNGVFDTVTGIFGVEAQWMNAGVPIASAFVLYNTPTDIYKEGGEYQYDPTHYSMEYKWGDFEGLVALIEARQVLQVFRVEGRDFHAQDVEKKYDGKTIVVRLLPVRT